VRRATLVWEPLGALPEDGAGPPLVFVHLLDDAGAVVRTFDHPYPTPWRVGAPVEDPLEIHQSALAPPLAPGRYRLTVGLYRRGGERYPLETVGEEVGRREYALATLAAAGSGAGLPAIEADGDWLPVEPGTDRQVLASRWLAGAGALVVAGAAEPGALWLRLQVPVAGAGNRLVLAADASEQEVRLTTPCGGAIVLVTGPGDRELELPVEPGAAGEPTASAAPDPGAGEAAASAAPARASAAGRCPVELSANYHLLGPDGARRVVRLDAVAWRRR
jgi:hypothetical protein